MTDSTLFCFVVMSLWFVTLHAKTVTPEVAVLANSKFASVLWAVEEDDQKMRLASEWQLAMDVVLTEVKAILRNNNMFLL